MGPLQGFVHAPEGHPQHHFASAHHGLLNHATDPDCHQPIGAGRPSRDPQGLLAMALARGVAFAAVDQVALEAGAFGQQGLEGTLGAEEAVVADGRSRADPHRRSRPPNGHGPVLMQGAIEGRLVPRG